MSSGTADLVQVMLVAAAVRDVYGPTSPALTAHLLRATSEVLTAMIDGTALREEAHALLPLMEAISSRSLAATARPGCGSARRSDPLESLRVPPWPDAVTLRSALSGPCTSEELHAATVADVAGIDPELAVALAAHDAVTFETLAVVALSHVAADARVPQVLRSHAPCPLTVLDALTAGSPSGHLVAVLARGWEGDASSLGAAAEVLHGQGITA